MTDAQDIEQLVATVQHSQQNALPEEFIGLFREDVIWTTAHGTSLTGKDEIAAWTREALTAAAKGPDATYEVEQISHLRPDVAAVKIRRRPVGAPGQQEGMLLYVLSKEDGRWQIAAGANTIVL